MTGEERLKINIKIGTKSFPLHVLQKDESKIRATAQLITETFEKYSDKFPNNGYDNNLAMAALTLLNANRHQANNEDSLELKDALYELEDTMEEFINENI